MLPPPSPAPAPAQHWVVVTYPGQGHINPALALTKRLMVSAHPGSRATFCTAAFAHNKMFPCAGGEVVVDGPITYTPFLVDGYEEGLKDDPSLYGHFLSQLHIHGSRSLASILASLSSPPTSVIYTSSVPWAADVARDLNIPSTLYWIQPATVFAIYYHLFHDYTHLIASHADHPSSLLRLPRLPPISVRDIPSFCNVPETDPYYGIHASLKKSFLDLDLGKGKDMRILRLSVLVNSFTELERDAIASVEGNIRLLPIGPLLGAAHLIKPDEEAEYMNWLDLKQEGSVIYVSFGSYAVLSKKQIEEIVGGLRSTGRPYVWVLRSNNRPDLGPDDVPITGDNGLVLGWCSQARVLAHPAVGCFVTHAGWNSTLEGLTSGTPMVCAPLWSDQATNARLVESVCGTGVVCDADTRDEDGVLPAGELKRCIELVMSDDGKADEMKSAARKWRDSARAAVEEGGSSYTNTLEFIHREYVV